MFKTTWIPAILWAGFILVLCGFPGNEIPHFKWADILSIDKAVHAIIFYILAYFIIKSLQADRFKKPELMGALIASIYGGVIEILQTFVFINRYGDFIDFGADALGAFLSAWWVFKKRK
jgi:VanZ family protein